MLKKLTYKQKNRLLLVAAVITVFAVYTLAVKKTFNVYSECGENRKKMEQASNAPAMTQQLEKELKHMEAKIGTHRTQESTNEELLSLITDYCQSHHAVLREFPETTLTQEGDLMIETDQFMIGGDFFTLLNLVYLLEQKYNLGKIASVNYQLKKDFKTKELQLTATIFLQNIKKKNHEE